VQVGGGPPPLTQRDRMIFANALDTYIAQNHRL
ncbi:MAG TPA: YaiI/YqxD family protein, partial [Porticoccaceae bacterium]|nr:YaiI/YqxD family protein [Porticoccaceae bacterium]